MKKRSIVSLKGPYSAVASGGAPAASDLAADVASWLRDSGLSVEGPDENEGYSWSVVTSAGSANVQSLIGYVGDDPQQFLITNHTSVGFLKGLFNRSVKQAEADALLAVVCAIVHKMLSGSIGVSDVRWYVQEEFDSNHGETWAPQP